MTKQEYKVVASGIYRFVIVNRADGSEGTYMYTCAEYRPEGIQGDIQDEILIRATAAEERVKGYEESY